MSVDNAYFEQEAQLKYGHTEAYQEFTRRQNKMSDSEKEVWQKQLQHNFRVIFQRFDEVSNLEIADVAVKAVVDDWREILMSVTNYSDEVLIEIAKMYRDDARFSEWFQSANNPRLSQFISESVAYHLG